MSSRITLITENILNFVFPDPPLPKNLKEINAEKLIQKTQPVLSSEEGVIAFFNYKDPQIRSLVHYIKYKNSKKMSELAAEALYSELIEYFSELYTFDNIKHVTIVPIPLSKKKLHKRGFNQSLRIAKKIQKLDKPGTLKLKANTLHRITDTPSQTQIRNKKQREQNLKGVFKVKDEKKIKGETVLLIDDVITTGATMREAKKELKKAGASKVICVALARS